MQNAEPSRFPDNVMYIYQKQLEEADLIVLNKADLVSSDELAEVEATLKREFTQAPVFTISALQGIGVDSWLDHVLTMNGTGRTITEVDYDEYAQGKQPSVGLTPISGSIRTRASIAKGSAWVSSRPYKEIFGSRLPKWHISNST